MVIQANAKINWSLAITGVRDDGYHTLDTLMQTVDFGDTLCISPADTLTLSVEGGMPIPADGDNLILQAARLLRAAGNTHRGAEIRLIKRIPVGAGLGGGSADAAAALRGLNAFWELDIPAHALAELALFLGADVPFCLTGGLARVGGIGEVITPLADAPEIPLVILQPEQGLSTPQVFRTYDAQPAPDRPSLDAVQAALQKNDLAALAGAMGNMLQPTAVGLYPEIAACMAALEGAGALRAQMTGSGSAVIGVFEGHEAAERAARACGQRWPKCWATRSVKA